MSGRKTQILFPLFMLLLCYSRWRVLYFPGTCLFKLICFALVDTGFTAAVLTYSLSFIKNLACLLDSSLSKSDASTQLWIPVQSYTFLMYDHYNSIHKSKWKNNTDKTSNISDGQDTSTYSSICFTKTSFLHQSCSRGCSSLSASERETRSHWLVGTLRGQQNNT